MSVKRRDILKYFENCGYWFKREGGNHTIYTNGKKCIPIGRHSTFNRKEANKLCKEANIPEIF